MPFTLTVDPAVRLSSKDAHHRPCSTQQRHSTQSYVTCVALEGTST